MRTIFNGPARSLFFCLLTLTCVSCQTKRDQTSLPEAMEEIEDQAAQEATKGDGLLSYESAWAPLPMWSEEIGFKTLFAPEDPTAHLELSLIDEVISACLQDPQCKAHQETSSDYRIRYAVYNLTSDLLIERLIEAESVGVDVQILIEGDQLRPERTWLTLYDRFEEAGLRVERYHHLLSEEELSGADLIGISGSGLMHLKMRLFEMPNHSLLLTGSYNPNTTSPLNEESLHYTDQEWLIDLYRQTYWSVLYDFPIENNWDESQSVNVMFTPASKDRAISKVFEWLESEEEQILLMMFSLRNLTSKDESETLTQLLKRKVEAGVTVAVITDQKQSDGIDAEGKPIFYDDPTEDALRGAGIPVYEVINRLTPYTAMHHKVAILGQTQVRVISGASNWTKSGLGSGGRLARNVESVLFIDSARLDQNETGYRYLGQWIRILRRYEEYSLERGTSPSVSSMINQLWSQDHWPELSLHIEASGVEIADNERVMIGGESITLGQWDTNELIPMAPRISDQSEWVSERLWFPIGQIVPWKFAITDERGRFKYWEPGLDRSLEANLSLSRSNNLLCSGEWR